MEVSRTEKEDPIDEANIEKKLDARALFVLKSRGSWLQYCGYHLTTSIVAPALLSPLLALPLLSWFARLTCLLVSTLVTFYSYNFCALFWSIMFSSECVSSASVNWLRISSVPLHTGMGRYFVSRIQFGLCYDGVIACILLGGQSLKLYQMVAIFGILMLVLVQIPSFQSLRHINLISLILCLAYSTCTTAGSIYTNYYSKLLCILAGHSKKAPEKVYSVSGTDQDPIFGSFNAISIIAITYGNGIIPEIHATIAAPVKGKMLKGLCVCYAVVITTFVSVAISGYRAFSNQAQGTVLLNYLVDGKPLLLTWVLLMTNVFTLLQVSAVAVVDLQPTTEVLERKFADPKIEQFSIRNTIPRLVFRSSSVVIATTVATMFHFFRDINTAIGAFGCIPLDFILPIIFYNFTFKPSKNILIFWGNTRIASIYSTLWVLGALSSIRQIVLYANKYSPFADI